MKLQFLKKISVLCALLFCAINPAKAALITTEFSDLVGSGGSVDIRINLSSGEIFNGFSLYFSESLFTNLAIVSSPVEWDSIVIQPDALLGAGLFDSYNAAGLSSGVARVSFTYLAATPFETLAYDFYDADLNIIESGTSTNVTTPVPESSSILLLMLGLLALGLRNVMRNHKGNSSAIFQYTQQQVAA